MVMRESRGYMLGVTGGIGTGKTLLCSILNESHGAPVIDADRLGHEALEPGTSAHAQIRARFGATILSPDGTIDRGRLARIVFSDPGSLAALNAISHPWILMRISEEASRLMQSEGAGIIVIDAALLLDWIDRFRPDGVVLVTASLEARLERLARRGLSRGEANRRIISQGPPPAGLVDWTVRNDGSLADLRRRAEDLWREVLERARAKERGENA